MEYIAQFTGIFLETLRDVVPIAAVLFGFQILVLRRPIPHLGRVLTGFALVLLGLAFFLMGLEQALFPLGKLMAAQLTNPEFLGLSVSDHSLKQIQWKNYLWVYLFAAAIGFSTTIA